jgi:hypothetical protein
VAQYTVVVGRWLCVPDWLYPYFSGAGSGARARYRAGTARWQRRVFRRPRLIAALAATPVAVVAVLERDQLWLWAGGVLLGVLLGAYITLLESPPPHVEQWRTGFEGERRTARALARLRRDGFVLFHDLPDRQTGSRARSGNIDHVVVSQAGVFLLDSKWFGGEVSIVGETVHVQRRDDDDASYDARWLARGMRGRAVRLQEDLGAERGVRFVYPVVVFWSPFEAGLVQSGNIVFLHGGRLASWLEAQPAVMSAERVAEIAACVKHVCAARRRLGPAG